MLLYTLFGFGAPMFPSFLHRIPLMLSRQTPDKVYFSEVLATVMAIRVAEERFDRLSSDTERAPEEESG